MTTTTDLERARRLHDQHAWSDAFEALAAADSENPLGADDLNRLATAAYMLGRDDDYANALERAHHLYVEDDDAQGAARTAFWLGLNLMLHGQIAPANGWFAVPTASSHAPVRTAPSGAIC